MTINKIQKNVISTLFGSAFLVFGQSAVAHTTIADSSLTEGQSVYTASAISHGCDGTAVRAQSILFPTGNNPLALDNNGNPVDLGDHFVNVDHSGNESPLASGSGVPASPGFVQDKNVFRTLTTIKDANGTTVGMTYNNGYLQADLRGWVPFRMSAPRFASASCADSIAIRIPILNACNKSASAANRVDAWVGRLTAKYNDPSVVSINFWPTVNVARDLENNPLPESCAEGIQLDVSPNDQQIDDFLGVPGYWPNN